MRQRLFVVCVVSLGLASLALAQSELLDHRYNESPPRYTVALGDDGVLQGWAGYVDASTGEFRGAPGALVHLLQGGELIEETQAGQHGHFEISGVRPGVYAVSAIDEHGFSASAFHVVAADEEAAYSRMLCTMISHDDFSVVGDEENPLANASDLAVDGMSQGGGSGGGGGGGLGGIFGMGLGAVGLGFGIAALADDGDSQPVASPVFP